MFQRLEFVGHSENDEIYLWTKPDQNIVIQFFHRYLARRRKFSKTVITREGQRMGTNSFALRLVYSRPTNWYIFHSKMRLTLGNVPSLAIKCIFQTQNSIQSKYKHDIRNQHARSHIN